jgi:uncharacterized protein YacL
MSGIIFRVVFVFLCGVIGYLLAPFGLGSNVGFLLGIGIGGGAVALDVKVRRTPFKIIAFSLFGLLIGLLLAYFLCNLVDRFPISVLTRSILHIFLFVILGYVGLMVGAKKGEWFSIDDIKGILKSRNHGRRFKILDTSVIIDGRIADICQTGFIEGTLVVPQFVLRELQQIADSSDTLRRNRGRRGLDILQKMKKMSGISLQFYEMDFPEIREVDQKLIELCQQLRAKIVTNDFNLNKIAQLRGVRVLNINELANALKPVVLPGETMRVFILKEGKEVNQGVAYLDDGTMVVVDNGKKHIGKTVDIVVTSVLQTTAGKMIFARYEGS